MTILFRVREWLADHFDAPQYPKLTPIRPQPTRHRRYSAWEYFESAMMCLLLSLIGVFLLGLLAACGFVFYLLLTT